jgi:hypothetical protein
MPCKAVDDGGMVTETVGGNGGQEQWQQSRGCGQGDGLGASVWTVRLTGGPHSVLIFLQFIQNWLNIKNSKWVLYLAPKIPNFCIRLALDIMNNFLNSSDIQFPR